MHTISIELPAQLISDTKVFSVEETPATSRISAASVSGIITGRAVLLYPSCKYWADYQGGVIRSLSHQHIVYFSSSSGERG